MAATARAPIIAATATTASTPPLTIDVMLTATTATAKLMAAAAIRVATLMVATLMVVTAVMMAAAVTTDTDPRPTRTATL